MVLTLQQQLQAGTTETSADGNTNYAADEIVRINTTGKTLYPLTDAGLDNG